MAVEVVNGVRTTEPLSTTMQHELGHALDFMKNQHLLDNVKFEAKRSYNPVENLRKYYRKEKEVTARLIEQYVAIKK
jgi:predicted Zn-dependent protease